jgi:hypothetical protein
LANLWLSLTFSRITPQLIARGIQIPEWLQSNDTSISYGL